MEDLKGIASQLTGLLGNLQKQTSAIVNQLDEKDREKLAPLQAKMSEAVNAIKKGDTSKLTNIMEEAKQMQQKQNIK